MDMEYDEALLSNLTVPELQQECKRRGLKKSGIKVKLIQRLSEHIQKHGPNSVVPPAPPAAQQIIEKSVSAIHNPHPYMAEYEQQLIDSANKEAEAEAVHPYMEEYEQQLIDTANMEAEAETEYYNPPAKGDTSTSAGMNEPEDYTETPEEEKESEIPDESNNTSFEKPQSVESPTLDPRDMAEELTEPIHKSPVYEDDHNDRIVQLPEDDDKEREGRSSREEVDAFDELPENDFASQDAVDDEMEDRTNADVETYSSTERDVGEDVVSEALHGEDVEEEADEPLDYTDTEDADNSEMHYNEGGEREAANEEDVEEERFNGMHDKEEETFNDMEDTEERFDDMQDKEEERLNNMEETEEESFNDMQETKEERYNDMQDIEEEEQTERCEKDDMIAEEIDVDEEKVIDVNNEDEDHNESGEVEVEEDGEITINDESQNEFEENDVDGGDDHLDVMIHVQDDKITEDSEPEEVIGTPKPAKKAVIPVSLKKRVSLIASTESAEEKAARRKRRWGSSTTLKESTAAISSESIKKLIPNMKIDASVLESVPELDYQEEDPVDDSSAFKQPDDVEVIGEAPPPKVNKMGRTVKVDSAKKITLNKPATQEVVSIESDSGEAAKSTATQSVRTYMVEEEVEVQEQREKSPSPARNPYSLYIYIENLVRPYTINQLKAVIRRTGVIQEGGFWINNIKSHCFVKLSSEEESCATRNALHGLRWPAGSPKLLRVDFALNEKMFAETDGLLGEKPKIVIEIEDKENDPVIITNECTYESRKERNAERNKARGERKRRLSVKEVETEKEKEKTTVEREESPAKLLDDLFRKTKATPCIYWLPLTEEQILEKEKKAAQIEINERSQREQLSNDRNQDRRSYHQFRSSNRSWR